MNSRPEAHNFTYILPYRNAEFAPKDQNLMLLFTGNVFRDNNSEICQNVSKSREGINV